MPNYLDLAKELIALPTTDGAHNAFENTWSLIDSVLDTYRYKRYMSNGYESRVYYGNGSLPEKFEILLNAHIDVVPGNTNQYDPKVEGDKLIGRGSYDMKGATAVLLQVFQELVDTSPYKIGFLITTDEEQGGYNGVKVAMDAGLKADFVLSGETTDLKIVHKIKGIKWVEIFQQGRSSHAAHPWKGENALDALIKRYSSFKEKYPTPKTEDWVTTVNLSNLISDNKANNSVPENAKMTLDIRFTNQTEEKLNLDLEEAFSGENCSYQFLLNEPGPFTQQTDPYIQKLCQSLEAVSGSSAQFGVAHGSSDMRFFGMNGVPGIEFGPRGGGHHTDHEWVSIQSLEKYKQIISNWLVT